MSFLRAERMQNKQLGRNELQKSGKLGSLRAGLQRSSYKVSEDKLFTLPTNSDTVLMDDYKQDVFSHEGLVFRKLSKMMENTRSILELELRTSKEVIQGLYGEKPIFVSA
jgi:histidine ammonia-lyase